MDINYRMLDPHSSDEIQQWRELFGISFNTSVSESTWRWKYLQNPFRNEEKPHIYVAESSDSIVGSLFIQPMQFNFQSGDRKDIISVGLLGNAMVHPDFRNGGIFSALLRYTMNDAAGRGLKILFGFTNNPISRRGFLRHNWREVVDSESYMFFLNPRQALNDFLSATRYPAFMRQILTIVPAEPYGVRSFRRQRHQYHFSCGKVGDYLAAIEQVHNNNLGENRISGVRNQISLRWLFGDPERKYLFFGMWSGEELQAYIVVRLVDSGTSGMRKSALIEDSFSQNKKSSLDSRLFSYMVEQLKDHQFIKISGMFFPEGPLGLSPLFKGFIPRRKKWTLLYWLAEEESIAGDLQNRIHWDLHELDAFAL